MRGDTDRRRSDLAGSFYWTSADPVLGFAHGKKRVVILPEPATDYALAGCCHFGVVCRVPDVRSVHNRHIAGATASPPDFSNCMRIRLAPQPGCLRRISTTTTSTSPLHRCGQACGRRDRSTRPATPSARTCSTSNEPSAATPHPSRHLGHRRTRQHQGGASNRCSTTDNATNTNPDLPSPTPPRGHRTQVAEDRPMSSVNWHTELSSISWHSTLNSPELT
jgi:hypothetical protein